MTRTKSLHFVVLLVAVIGAGIAFARAWTHLHSTPVRPLRICMPLVPCAASIVYADITGRFRQQGIEVSIEPVMSGRLGLERLLAGDCDLVVCRETPIALAAMRQKPIRIVATIATSEEGRGILGRRDRGVIMVSDLVGRKIGCVRETSADYILDGLLDYHGINLQGIERVDGAPDELVRAMEEGRLDAISIWSPHSDHLMATMDGKLVHIDSDVTTSAYWNLVGREGIDADLVTRTLRAIHKGGKAIEVDPATAAEECAKMFDLSAAQLEEQWKDCNFALQLDQALILALERHGRWAMLKGYVPQQSLPNFLDVVTPLPLASIDPQLVSVIHPAVKP